MLAGVAEIALAVARGLDRIGITALVSGLLSAAAGLTFHCKSTRVVLPRGQRGDGMANGARPLGRADGMELVGASPRPPGFSRAGRSDICLALVLAAGLPVAALVYVLFGPTPELVAKFSLILGASFLATGIAQVAIGLHQRSAGSVEPDPQNAVFRKPHVSLRSTGCHTSVNTTRPPISLLMSI